MLWITLKLLAQSARWQWKVHLARVALRQTGKVLRETVDERDRARDLAARLEAENYELQQIIVGMEGELTVMAMEARETPESGPW